MCIVAAVVCVMSFRFGCLKSPSHPSNTHTHRRCHHHLLIGLSLIHPTLYMQAFYCIYDHSQVAPEQLIDVASLSDATARSHGGAGVCVCVCVRACVVGTVPISSDIVRIDTAVVALAVGSVAML